MNIYFHKMQSLGNDFVVLETITQAIPISPEWIRKIAHRHLGVGCDQVLVVGNTQHPDADFEYSIYNADGSAALQCGNGARCVALFVKEKKFTDKNKIIFATNQHLTVVDMLNPDHISAAIGVPRFDPHNPYTLTVADTEITCGLLSIGNPHAIIQVNDIKTAPVNTIGQALQKENLFPEGVNVSFCQILSQAHIKLRVYERGIGETLACGSGAGATMAYLHHLGLIKKEVTMSQAGGDLKVSWHNPTDSVILIGNAINVFQGTYF